MIRALHTEKYHGLYAFVEAVLNKSNPCVAKGSKLGETAFASERSLSALSAKPISDGPSICQSQRESCQVRGYPHSHTFLEEKVQNEKQRIEAAQFLALGPLAANQPCHLSETGLVTNLLERSSVFTVLQFLEHCLAVHVLTGPRSVSQSAIAVEPCRIDGLSLIVRHYGLAAEHRSVVARPRRSIAFGT